MTTASTAFPKCFNTLRFYCEIKKALNCWKCNNTTGNLRDKFFCPTCSTIQPVSSANYFEYFDTKPSFEINDDHLKTNFFKLQSRVHPDKSGTWSQKEKEISEQCSRFLNEAYRTLKEPIKRAQYLLNIKGTKPIGDDEIVNDNEFMMEMMEENESVQELQNESSVAKIEEIDKKINALVAQLTAHFELHDYVGARETVSKLTFYYRLKENVNRKLGNV